VPLKVRAAIRYLIDVNDDLQAAALHAGLSIHELRRSLGQPEVRRYALAERQVAIERFVLGSPAALARVRDTSENGMAVVAAVKAGELRMERWPTRSPASSARLVCKLPSSSGAASSPSPISRRRCSTSRRCLRPCRPFRALPMRSE
jgi:hypothetical protein